MLLKSSSLISACRQELTALDASPMCSLN